jgi:anti-sigma regulatory factor (Ser/Thr protein kinase)
MAVRDVAPSHEEPGRTRHWAAAVLARWDLAAEVDRTLLVLNELVTNAVVHATGGGSCRLTIDRGELEILVTDGGDGPPRRAIRAADAPEPVAWEQSGGRGLQIVGAVAGQWGATFVDGRAGVWARWQLASGWPHAATCGCDGPDGDQPDGDGSGLRLGSGGLVVPVSGPWDDAVDVRHDASRRR